jgi:hypothetical protein
MISIAALVALSFSLLKFLITVVPYNYKSVKFKAVSCHVPVLDYALLKFANMIRSLALLIFAMCNASARSSRYLRTFFLVPYSITNKLMANEN